MHADVRARKITGTGGKDKATVPGILQRGGKVRTKAIENRRKKALQSEVRAHVEAGSALYTDSLKSYEGLDEFQHQVVDHAVDYVRGNVNTNTNGLENFWSLVKRGLNGTYVSNPSIFSAIWKSKPFGTTTARILTTRAVLIWLCVTSSASA